MFGVAEAADGGQDIQAELVIRQGEVRLRLGPIGSEEAGAIGIGATSDQERQPKDAVEGSDRAKVIVVSMKPSSTFGTVKRDGNQAQRAVRFWARSSSFAHR